MAFGSVSLCMLSHTHELAYLPDRDREREQVSASAKLTLGTSLWLPRKQSHVITEMVTGETDATDLLERGEGRDREWKKGWEIYREGERAYSDIFCVFL